MVLSPLFLQAQVIVNSESWEIPDHLVLYKDNLIQIVTQQKHPVSLSQLSASCNGEPVTILEGETPGYFIISKIDRPIEIYIDMGAEIVTKQLRARLILPDTASLGSWSLDGDIELKEFLLNARQGLKLKIGNRNMGDSCRIKSFTLTRISTKEVPPERIQNFGAKLTEETKKIIDKASRGDIFFFNSIYCECLLNNYRKRYESNSLVFTIK